MIIIVWFKNWLLWKAHNSAKTERKQTKNKNFILVMDIMNFDGRLLVDQMKQNFNVFFFRIFIRLDDVNTNAKRKQKKLRLPV